MDEYILCAAIHYEVPGHYIHQPENIQKGFVICGWRHHNCIAIQNILNLDRLPQYTQGFLTNTNRFLSREEALVVARAAEQVGGTTHHRTKLFSEDLY